MYIEYLLYMLLILSFKVVVPFEMKDTMLDKRNWKKNVYIREFFENSRSLASLSAKY